MASLSFPFSKNPFLGHKSLNPSSIPTTTTTTLSSLAFPSIPYFCDSVFRHRSRRRSLSLCFVVDDVGSSVAGPTQIENSTATTAAEEEVESGISAVPRVEERQNRKRSERFTYLVAAIMSSSGITSLAIVSVYYRFYWQMEVRPQSSA